MLYFDRSLLAHHATCSPFSISVKFSLWRLTFTTSHVIYMILPFALFYLTALLLHVSFL
uniref:Uncharacterized protein n=1 Tax=Octopus bimaculoides TaxID=37653 RepID=A0A0L8I9S5_OCTBM